MLIRYTSKKIILVIWLMKCLHDRAGLPRSICKVGGMANTILRLKIDVAGLETSPRRSNTYQNVHLPAAFDYFIRLNIPCSEKQNEHSWIIVYIAQLAKRK